MTVDLLWYSQSTVVRPYEGQGRESKVGSDNDRVPGPTGMPSLQFVASALFEIWRGYESRILWVFFFSKKEKRRSGE